MSKVLVVGGAGYVGSVLCKHLLNEDYEVTTLDNLMFNQHSLLGCCSHNNFTFVKGDLRDYNLVKQSEFNIINNINNIISFNDNNLRFKYLFSCDNSKYLELLFNYLCIYYMNKDINYLNNNIASIYKTIIFFLEK